MPFIDTYFLNSIQLRNTDSAAARHNEDPLKIQFKLKTIQTMKKLIIFLFISK